MHLYKEGELVVVCDPMTLKAEPGLIICRETVPGPFGMGVYLVLRYNGKLQTYTSAAIRKFRERDLNWYDTGEQSAS